MVKPYESGRLAQRSVLHNRKKQLPTRSFQGEIVA